MISPTPQHPETDRCGFDRDASLSADCYVCTCGYIDRDTPNPRPSGLSQRVFDAIAAGPAFLSPLHPQARQFGKKRETAEEFAARIALLALSEKVPIDADYYNQMADGLDLLPTQSTENAALVNCAARLIRSLASKNAAPQEQVTAELCVSPALNGGDRPRPPSVAAPVISSDKQETLLERAIRRLHDNIARREATEDVEALKAVLLEMASQKERGDRWQKISDQRAIEVADLKRDLSKALANHSADLSATLSIPKPEVAVPVGGKSIQLSYFGDGEREAALEAFKRWLG